MALLTGFLGGERLDLCATARGSSPPSEMLLMYLLMSVFHLPPWLKLVSRCRTGARISV
jgi:hypothetical protein